MTGKSALPSIPGWEILGHLGAGGMGDVWKARRADGVLAAVKVAKPVKGLASDEVASLFRREALACLHVDHPSLVRALDAGTTAGGRAYLALEFVEGRTLDAAIEDGGALSEARVVEIGVALAKALDHVHRMGLAHRDVKPRNVMLCAIGGVKLLDFGLVVETADDGGEHGMGTYGFVAPEVVSGNAAGPRSDFYSLGATLAAAATGASPGRDRSLADTSLPETVDGEPLSPGFRQVVRRLLRREPAARYGSAAEIVLDLEAVAAGERPLGAILGAAGARAVRRGPRIVAAIAGAAVATAAIWWTATRGGDAPRIEPAASPAAPSPPATRNPKLEAAAVFIEQFPAEFVRGRQLIADLDASALTAEDRAELRRLQDGCDRRFAAAAAREFEERQRRMTAAVDAGDVPQARRIAAEWPDALRESPLAERLTQAAEAAAARWGAENRELATDVENVVRSASQFHGDLAARCDELIAKIDTAIARPEFDGDERPRLAASRRALEEVKAAAADALAGARAWTRWREALAAHVAAPSADRLRAALDAAADAAMRPATRDAARAFGGAWSRAETRLAVRFAVLKGKPWCGPRAGALYCGVVDGALRADDVFPSPLWSESGGRVASIVAAANGADEAAAWLFARGLWSDAIAASGPSSAVADWLAESPPAPPTAPSKTSATWPTGFDVDLALRDVGSVVAPRPGSDVVVAAWASATDPKTRPTTVASRNPDKSAGRDAFVNGDVALAVASLSAAAVADPRDAEIAALRGRTVLVAARALATPPALLAAFAEGRRAWDLDPKLPAGPVLAAEAGIAFLDVADGAAAARMRPVVAAACDAADALGRADARMLLFAGESRLAAGRAADAAGILRRAAAEAPTSGPAALSLARAEHACGRDDKAREALRRARDLLGGTLPASAADLAHSLGL